MLTNILKYQALEEKLLALQKRLDDHPAKTAVSNMVIKVKTEQNKLLNLENQAEQLLKEFDNLKQDYEKSLKKMNEYLKVDTDNIDETKFDALIKNTESLSNTLNNLERKISTTGMRVNQILQQFDNAKKNIIVSRNEHKKAKEKLENVKTELEPQITSIQKQMLELEKNIEPKIMLKYKHLRQDNIFPVFVPLNNNSCGGCRMEVSAAFINKVKEKGCLECEQCRRLVYIK